LIIVFGGHQSKVMGKRIFPGLIFTE